MHRLLMAALAAGCLALAAPQVVGYQVYVGPSDADGRVYVTPPTPAQMQKMIDERVEKHACMHKSGTHLMALRSPDSPFSVVDPTVGMYNYDVTYYKINISIDMTGESVSGYVEMTAKSLVNGLAQVDLTLTPDLTVSAVRLGGVAQSFVHSTEVMTVMLTQPFDIGEEFTLKIEYNGVPPYYNLDGMEFYTFSGRKVCYTNCEPWGARNWWPCKDFTFDKADSADILITHPTTYGGYTMDCVSNGKLVSVTNNGGGTTTTHWHEGHPITTYLVAIVVTDFSKNTQYWEYESGHQMPVEHNYFPSIGPTNPSGSTYYMVNYTIPALDALSNYWGLYPFVDEKYGHMHYGWNGAMEHQTSTSISPYFNEEYVIPHEMGHQWAGDDVTCWPINDMWLNEGFASYSEVLYFEYRYGPEYGKQWLGSQKHLSAGSPYVENLQTDDVFDGTTVYDKGSWLVHMLRNQLGDTVFFPAMNDYFHTSEYVGRSANTDQFNDFLSQYYGSDMSWFFNAWVYQEGQPNYKYSYRYEADSVNGGYRVDFFLAQQNSDGIFPMHVEIKGYAGDFDTLVTVWNGTAGDFYQLHFPSPPDSFEVDPSEKILRTVAQVPFTMHIASSSVGNCFYGVPFSFHFTAVGGTPPYTWQKTLGQFPYGLTLNQSTGELHGTPGWKAQYYFKIKCTDSSSPALTEEREYTVVVTDQMPQSGDCDHSGDIDIDDIVFLINYVFGGGPAPNPLSIGDVNCSGFIDIDDIVHLINYVFGGGPAPC